MVGALWLLSRLIFFTPVVVEGVLARKRESDGEQQEEGEVFHRDYFKTNFGIGRSRALAISLACGEPGRMSNLPDCNQKKA